MANDPCSQSPAIVMVPLPFQGHTTQLLHLSRLVSAQNLPVYFVGTTTLIRQAKTRLQGWDPSSSAAMHFHEFPTPDFENPPPNPNAPSRFPSHLIPPLMSTIRLREPVHAFVNELSTKYRKVIVIYDLFMSYVVQDIHDTVQNAEAYRFQCPSAFTSFSFHWKNEPSVPPEAVELLTECPSADGVIEPLYLDLIEKQKAVGAEKIWALGPLNPVSLPEKRDSETQHKCLDWLDKQEPDSVIFISFGTTISFSDQEIKEIAIGLERSFQKFLWVLRDADKGDVFTGDVRKLSEILPLGFEERVKDKGMILTDWAPQLEILAHFATGGFMSHCGWNSCLESISMGVPIATWPMHSDQPRNAVLITKGLRIGVEVVNWERRSENVSSDMVEKAVRKLMASEEGDEIRKSAKELGIAVKKSFMEGGDARKEFDAFIAHITR
ncbi:hypothetical protein DH2020_041540 [Rehmannia glutinosa]|uniref:Glycosyltransferase n=1 Tax=Rehmannia glutinosa TaxID=99300 RepID=A0ABR0UQI4_REHGL